MKICIVDYGLGNLFSLCRAIEFLGERGVIEKEPERIVEADRVILPGVGAFGNGVKNLRDAKLDTALYTCVDRGIPLLGVCLGMQLLFSSSDEFGCHVGLNIVPGKVKRFSSSKTVGGRRKVPNLGWRQVVAPENAGDKKILRGVEDSSFMYFAHSYYVEPEQAFDILTTSVYANTEFCSAVAKGHVYGVQFHPELSGNAGLMVLRNFIQD